MAYPASFDFDENLLFLRLGNFSKDQLKVAPR
jgi:hypothetical protein